MSLFHPKHFPTFRKLPGFLNGPKHWTTHAGLALLVFGLLLFGIAQTSELVRLRHLIAVDEAQQVIENPYGKPRPSLLGPTLICQPAFLRWYYGTGPLCDQAGE